eukprot:TRINITY_DN972_c0_g1_i1.p1 TRINITY_DN972_c0_g1~~TRINITY_DN972_c0_g1_i1.p1  ORF type:complete len:104 (-),score=1.44 TRINITY_DN972_c0_g1_i1:171-482(-)
MMMQLAFRAGGQMRAPALDSLECPLCPCVTESGFSYSSWCNNVSTSRCIFFLINGLGPLCVVSGSTFPAAAVLCETTPLLVPTNVPEGGAPSARVSRPNSSFK